MNCVSYDMRVPLVLLFCDFFLGVFLSSRMSGACTVTTDLIMRVNMITRMIFDAQSGMGIK